MVSLRKEIRRSQALDPESVPVPLLHSIRATITFSNDMSDVSSLRVDVTRDVNDLLRIEGE